MMMSHARNYSGAEPQVVRVITALITLSSQVIAFLMRTIYSIDHHVEKFMNYFRKYYTDALDANFEDMPLTAQVSYVKMLYKVCVLCVCVCVCVCLLYLSTYIFQSTTPYSCPLPPSRKCWVSGRCPSSTTPTSWYSLACSRSLSPSGSLTTLIRCARVPVHVLWLSLVNANPRMNSSLPHNKVVT